MLLLSLSTNVGVDTKRIRYPYVPCRVHYYYLPTRLDDGLLVNVLYMEHMGYICCMLSTGPTKSGTYSKSTATSPNHRLTWSTAAPCSLGPLGDKASTCEEIQ